MFAMLRVKPPHGWNAVLWELGIVTAGVLIALGVQQWAEDRSWRAKARGATDELRDEVSQHYRYAAEWRVIQPCLYAQIDRLAARLIDSGDRINPAPVYSEPGFDFYVMRMPNRTYRTSAWQAAINDGVTAYLDPTVRRELSLLHSRLTTLTESTSLNNLSYPRLFGLSRPLPLDAGTRIEFLKTLDELRGRVEYMGLLSGQSIGNIERAGLTPDRSKITQLVAKAGTYRFCRRMRLPLTSITDAMKPFAE